MKSVHKHRRPVRHGYTLLEVLIVVAIIAVIAAMVVPNLIINLETSKEQVTQAEMANIENAFKMYRVSHSTFPNGGAEVFEQLTMQETDPRTGRLSGPTFEKLPKDGWGNPFNYEYPTSRFTNGVDKPAIWSNGKNQTNDNGDNDDINNWNSQQQP